MREGVGKKKKTKADWRRDEDQNYEKEMEMRWRRRWKEEEKEPKSTRSQRTAKSIGERGSGAWPALFRPALILSLTLYLLPMVSLL